MMIGGFLRSCSAGIRATVPLMGHSCYIFAPSDFESVGGENQACRGRTWYVTSLQHPFTDRCIHRPVGFRHDTVPG